MEPLAAIALAGNIIQFIDVARKLLLAASEIKHSHNGATDNQNNLLVITNELDHRFSMLDRDCDPELRPVLQQTRDVGLQLRQALEKLGVAPGNHFIKTTFHAIRTTWKRRELDAMRDRFERLCAQLESGLQERFR